jgi:glycosyltransferase involved in cell wall biosynthesis
MYICYILYTISGCIQFSMMTGRLCGRLNGKIHIGFDIRKYRDFGIGTYIQNLLDQFNIISDNGMTLFAGPEDASEIEAKYSRSSWETEINTSKKYSIQELFSLSAQARSHHLDVLHCPHYTLPLGLRCKSVVTIHDLIHLRFPEYFSYSQRVYAKMMIGHACASADRIIVDSQFTQEDVEREFPKSIGKIETIHLGVSERFGLRLTAEENENFLKRFGLTTPYILYVGSAKPHKNIGVLLQAYRQSGVRSDVHLVSAGEPLSMNAEAAAYFTDGAFSRTVHELGHIANDDLASAYQNALAVVLPSRYEGFGFAVIEAMKAGVPVIGARAASIPEVMGDAGLLFDPNSPDELAGLLERVIRDEDLRRMLVAKGRERVALFSWEACAKKTMDAYQKALQ